MELYFFGVRWCCNRTLRVHGVRWVVLPWYCDVDVVEICDAFVVTLRGQFIIVGEREG